MPVILTAQQRSKRKRIFSNHPAIQSQNSTQPARQQITQHPNRPVTSHDTSRRNSLPAKRIFFHRTLQPHSSNRQAALKDNHPLKGNIQRDVPQMNERERSLIINQRQSSIINQVANQKGRFSLNVTQSHPILQQVTRKICQPPQERIENSKNNSYSASFKQQSQNYTTINVRRNQTATVTGLHQNRHSVQSHNTYLTGNINNFKQAEYLAWTVGNRSQYKSQKRPQIVPNFQFGKGQSLSTPSQRPLILSSSTYTEQNYKNRLTVDSLTAPRDKIEKEYLSSDEEDIVHPKVARLIVKQIKDIYRNKKYQR